jgi:hypothetical protein
LVINEGIIGHFEKPRFCVVRRTVLQVQVSFKEGILKKVLSQIFILAKIKEITVYVRYIQLIYRI